MFLLVLRWATDCARSRPRRLSGQSISLGFGGLALEAQILILFVPGGWRRAVPNRQFLAWSAQKGRKVLRSGRCMWRSASGCKVWYWRGAWRSRSRTARDEIWLIHALIHGRSTRCESARVGYTSRDGRRRTRILEARLVVGRKAWACGRTIDRRKMCIRLGRRTSRHQKAQSRG